jgi:hypothetical protein
VNKKEATMNLGWIQDDDVVTGEERSLITHQFGHVLGLVHEQVWLSRMPPVY